MGTIKDNDIRLSSIREVETAHESVLWVEENGRNNTKRVKCEVCEDEGFLKTNLALFFAHESGAQPRTAGVGRGEITKSLVASSY